MYLGCNVKRKRIDGDSVGALPDTSDINDVFNYATGGHT